MSRRRDGEATRDKILSAAASVFALKGYRVATVADIAGAAGVNGALVNYYFGEKAGLYRCAWEFAHTRAMEKYPLYGTLNENAPAVKRLQEIIASDIARRGDPESCENDIMLQELSAPTGVLEDVHARAVAGFRAALRQAVADILGRRVPELEQRMAVLAIFAMCAVPVKQFQQLEGPVNEPFDLEVRARQVYNFAMAGLLDLLSRGES